MHPSVNPDHALHDLALIAAHAAGDTQIADMSVAAALLSTCASCAELHRDLVAIAAATRALPTALHAPRDFSITRAQADRLRRGSWLRGVLRPFAARRSATKPWATALTSAGVAGLLVAALAPGLLGGAASAPNRDASFGAAQVTAAPEVPQAVGAGGPAGAMGAPTSVADLNKAEDSGVRSGASIEVAFGAAASPEATQSLVRGRTTTDSPGPLAAGSTPNLIALGSTGLLLLGLALFGLRFAATRLR
jgi:hypothetical protein